MNRIVALLACIAVLAPASFAAAQSTTAQFWEELGGSASGDGLSASTAGVPTGNRHVSVALGPDGRPVVAYVDGDVIRVRRWTGTAWEMIGPSGFSGQVPQIVTDANGRMYLAWRQFAGSTTSWEIFLLARDWTGTTWDALGNSASGGGISGAEGAAGVPFYSLALAPDGTPYVAYQTTTLARTDFTTTATGLDIGTQQIFVRYWTGTSWAFLGSGREGGGASNALSFRVDGSATTTFASHGAETPTMAIGDDGHPVIAFIYTNWFRGNPPEFNGENDDIYAVRWNGTAWGALGPALPTAPTGAGLGAPGGISNSPGWIREVSHDRRVLASIMVDRSGAPVLAWGETTESDGFRRIYVHTWNGTAWVGLASPSGLVDMIAYSYDTSVAQGVEGPILAWPRGGGVQSWVNVLQFSPGEGRWKEMGTGSATGQGISAPNDGGWNPRVAVTSAGIPTVAWIDTSPAVPQAYLRTFNERTLPDLSVSSVSAPASSMPGSSFTTTAVVRNGGTAAAPASTVNFYLAAGVSRGSGDVALGSRDVPALAVGGSAALDLTVTIPAATASGTWHILAVVDEANTVVELNESNNARASSAFTVGAPPAPDLDITALSAPTTVRAGDTLTVQHTIANIGTAASGAYTLRFFLSSDATLDAGDVTLATRSLTSLNAGASSTLTTTLTIPATTTAPASYRVIATATLDAGTDRDPSNNGAVSDPISVTPRDQPNLPDLTVSSITVPSTAQTGRPLAIGHTVSNAGAAAAGAFTVRFYLSTDATLDAGDVLLGSRTLTGLGSHASNTMVSTFTVPANLSVNTYHVLVVADALNQVTETDKTNNTGVSGPLAITAFLPDLTVTALTLPPTGQTGRPLAITSTVRNGGPAPAAASTVNFYLSSDANLDAGDVLIGSRAVAGLGAGASSTAMTTVTIPANTSAPNSYHVIAVADALNQVAESDETNNVFASPGVVAISLYRPDLTITTLTVPAAGATGRPLAITNAVSNVGPAPAGAFTVRFYLSSDETLDAGDVLLGARTIGSLAAGAVNSTTTTLTIPPATAAGTYFVIAVADAANQQVELDEGNNQAVSAPVTITLYRPDLAFTALTLPPGGAVGRPMAIRHTIKNNGPAPATPFSVSFYWSSDNVLDSGDVLLGTRTAGSLMPGASRAETATYTIPPGTTPGTYFVIAVIDQQNLQSEMDKTNNTMVSAPMPVTLYQPDFAMTAVTIPATAAAGRPLAVTTTLRNGGPAPSVGFTVRFYLSTDGTLDGSDVVLGARTMGGLGAGASRTDVTMVTVPANTSVPGVYQVVAVVDGLGRAELDTTNNAAASSAVTITAYRPDLTLSAVSAPTGAAAGRSLAVTTTTRNAGPAPAGAFTIRFYLSADELFDSGDVLLGTRAIGGLGAGASRTDVTTVTVPSGTTVPGSYRILGVVDAGQQAELDTSNNVTASGPISITAFAPDLTIRVDNLSGPVAAGAWVSVRETIQNVGSAPTNRPFTLAFYLSADGVLDAGDVLLGRRTFTGSLGAGAARSDGTSVLVPADLVVPSPYLIVAVVEAQQSELDVRNNSATYRPRS